MKKKIVDLSIIIPVYNEPTNILLTLQEIKRHIRIRHEILVIYDFDEDTTISVLKKVHKKNLFLIKNTIAKGPSGAIRSGIAQSRGTYVLVTMADLLNDLTHMPYLIPLVSCNSR